MGRQSDEARQQSDVRGSSKMWLWENWINEETGIKIAVGVITALILLLFGKLSSRLWRMLCAKVSLIWNCSEQLRRARGALGPSSGVWLATTIEPDPPSDYRRRIRESKPIILRAQLKGGVGKTTTAVNLIAHYANNKRMRVLGIDLDFQGSATSMALSEADLARVLEDEKEGRTSKAACLIDDRDGRWLLQSTEAVENVARARFIPSSYGLAGVENRLMLEWLIGDRKKDLRYHLAEVLHSEEVQNAFDCIIIDAPPRLTTACVQALCASTHVLIPTVLDDLSAAAVGTFANQLLRYQKLWPYLKILGVVGTMTAHVIDVPASKPGSATSSEFWNGLTQNEREAFRNADDALREALRRAEPPLNNVSMLPPWCCVSQKADLERAAGRAIAYARPGDNEVLRVIRGMFDRLGDELDERRTNGSGVRRQLDAA
jgi:cellulose biosynthesis protein BcsQ